jgi:hypothetical protein
MLFLPYSKVQALVTIDTSVKDSMWRNHKKQTVPHKQSKPTVEQG